ncbi:MAG: hypothetical protein IID33_11495 [Planctomycetes bacterium]|nr:hypothetical protein [Planctomycetota bacterium]
MARSNCLTSALVAGILLAAVGPAYGHVRLIVPNGGERLDVGSVFTIEWTILIQHNQLNWDLWYSTTGPTGPWTPIVMNLPPGSFNVGSVHTYDWVIPNTTSGRVRVRVRMDNSGTDYEDISDANFRIRQPVPGDLNCDRVVDALDIEPFIVALFEPEAYPDLYPLCNILRADINGDGNIDALDIEPFIALLFP